MRAVGIVCEYNPFHRGHLYQIEESRRRLGEDTAVICAMSGDFVQRGEAAIFDKFTRAEAACRCGADLVVELPLPWCLSSAEGFASGAVSMLAALGCEFLSFGSESGDLTALARLAGFALDPAAQERIRLLMDGDDTLSFARARQLAATELLGAEAERLSHPNDILAVEYLKAIRKQDLPMRPLAVCRVGGGHDSREEGEYPSAMRLRERLERGEDVSPYIPREAYGLLRRERQRGRMRNADRLDIALLSRLYRLTPETFEALPDAGGGAGRRLYKAVRVGGAPAQIAAAASTKRYTAARMRRMLLCAALGICADDTKSAPPYLRILASDEKGRAWLHARGDAFRLPVISRAADLKRCGAEARKLFALGAGAHDLYRLQFGADDDRARDIDWKTAMVIVQD